MPAGALGDLFHLDRVGRDTEREVRGAEAASLPGLSDKAAAFLAGRLQFGPGRIDLDPGAVVVELQREKAARVGRERHRLAAHDLRQHLGGVLRVARGDRQVMDHGVLLLSDQQWRQPPSIRPG